ncbi:unnamed protein product [Agarophyton chilense]
MPSPPIRTQVLSIFRDHRTRQANPALLNFRTKKPKLQHTFINPSTRALVASLVCISAPHGNHRLQLLFESAKDRVCSASHLAALVFGVDDAEFMPPLCILVQLLRAGRLRRDNIDHILVLQRVEYEMNSLDVCLCRGAARGISSLLLYAVEVCQEQHTFLLHALVSAVFPRTMHSLGPIHLRSRLLIAEKAIVFVKQYVESEGEGYEILLEWANQTVLPVSYSQQTTAELPNVTWTPELSGLATGRCCAEYLQEGELHESVLRKLFTAIQPADASDIYLACLNSFRQQMAEKTSNRILNGCWARVVLLGQRIADKSSFDDVNDDIVKKTMSSVSGALGALSATSDPFLSAVLICLARRLLIPAPSFPEGKQRSEVYQAHKDWFRHFIVQYGRKTVEGIIHALAQLLPLEPLELLRLNHRVFSNKRELARIMPDYLVRARSRISELDPKPRNFLSEEEAASAEGNSQNIKNSPKLVLSCAHFVTDFARTKELPRSLLRQINFHRYHFQKTTKAVLLDPLLFRYASETHDTVFIARKDNFEAHQINLIKHLAFKRKDKAISASEANTAVKSIHEARNARLNPVEQAEATETAREFSVDDSLQDIISGILETEIRLQHTNGFESSPSSERSVTKVLCMKLQKVLSGETRVNRAEVASDVLQSFCLAIAGRLPEQTTTNNREELKPNVLRDHEKWWVTTGKALRGMLLDIFGDPRTQALQKPLQYQMFALICTRTDLLPSSIIRSTAILTITILTLQSESSLTDLCYSISNSKMSPIVNVIIECLPLTSAIRVRNSITFIFYCALLVYSASETAIEVMIVNHGNDVVLETQGTLRSFQTICTEKLDSLLVFLQWIICFPWRLMEDRIRRNKKSTSSNQSHELSPFVNQISKVLVFFGHQGFQNLEVTRILNTELRCGWGREDAIYNFLEHLECAGKCGKSLLYETIHFLVTKDREIVGAQEWIQNGFVRFARDRTWCQRKNNGHYSAVDVSCLNYLCQEVKDHGAGVGREVLDLLLITDQCFFHCLSVPEAVRRITGDLIPCFWPLPRRHVIFMVRKLNTKCVCKSNRDHVLSDIHLFIANIAAEVFHDKIYGALDGLSADSDAIALGASIAQQVSEVIDAIQVLDRGSEENGSESSGFQNESIVSQVKKHSLCLGSTIVLSLYGNGIKRERCTNMLIQRVSLACRILPPLLVCEVLDSALGTAAMLPFCFRFCTTKDHRLKMMQTTKWMKILTTERLALINSRYTVPFYSREELRGTVANNEPLIQTCLQWLGKLNREKEDDPFLNSLPIAVCMGRVFGALHSIDTRVLKGFLERVGKKMVRVLVSNSMFTYQCLSKNETKCAEKLPLESIQRLREVRLKVQRDLLQAIGAILRTMRDISNKDFEEFLTSILAPNHDLEDEVRSILRAEDAVS